MPDQKQRFFTSINFLPNGKAGRGPENWSGDQRVGMQEKEKIRDSQLEEPDKVGGGAETGK